MRVHILPPPLLVEVGGARRMCSARGFVVREQFGKKIGGLYLVYLSPNFQRIFGSEPPEDVSETLVRGYDLREDAYSAEVVEGLEKEGGARTSLFHVKKIIEMGPDGLGLFDGRSNLNFVFSAKLQKLVQVRWWVASPYWLVSPFRLSSEDISENTLLFMSAGLADTHKPWLKGIRVFGATGKF